LKQRYSRENFRNFLKPSGILIDHKPKQPRPPKQTLLGATKQRHPKRWIIGAVVGLALVAELVATDGHGWESSWWGGNKPAQAVSPDEACVTNLINWINYANGDQDSSTNLGIIETFGQRSGIPNWILLEVSNFIGYASQNGIKYADNRVTTDSSHECSTLAGQGVNISKMPTPPRS
jgi:hypothetical protein